MKNLLTNREVLTANYQPQSHWIKFKFLVFFQIMHLFYLEVVS